MPSELGYVAERPLVGSRINCQAKTRVSTVHTADAVHVRAVKSTLGKAAVLIRNYGCLISVCYKELARELITFANLQAANLSKLQ